ncbi:MAG: class I SAM-dependent methyltransferase [Chitinophagaceae bacterium]|nr:class I SAM-dependent methyltransferase [Chitinophagaceae bacterium]MCW5905944.1 class I SAM-dependent methyltransferase [Chitinophagaceae bacterium]
MYAPLIVVYKYLQYMLKANNGKGHGTHSPFLYDFITHVLNDKKQYDTYQKIEPLRKQLLTNNNIINIEDFGAGSKTGLTKQRRIKDIAATSLKSTKFAQLLFRIVHYYQPQTIVELGTSLGITTAYLASAKPNTTIISMEGSSEILTVAKENFNALSLQNIQLVQGNFDETLQPAIQPLSQIDFAFLDGNHRYLPTVNYFNAILPKLTNQSIVILDDIHWSKEMEQAWNDIKQHPSVTLSIDLFTIGILLFKDEFKAKQHFAIRF